MAPIKALQKIISYRPLNADVFSLNTPMVFTFDII